MQFDAIVFPGQGAQKLGMASDFVESFDESRAVFDTANELLDFDVYKVCFEEADKLNQSMN